MISGGAFAVCFGLQVLAWRGLGWNPTDAYDKIRPSLFTGFLTAGGFLLSLKTLILVSLRKDVYENTEYIEYVKERQKEDPKIELYGPLKTLGEFLLWAVLSAVVTSGVHLVMALGTCLPALLSITALSCSGTTLALIVRAWMAIRYNLHMWFDSLKE